MHFEASRMCVTVSTSKGPKFVEGGCGQGGTQEGEPPDQGARPAPLYLQGEMEIPSILLISCFINQP